MPLSVQFATTSDGVRVAYVVDGAGPPLVFLRGWITHLELMWAEASFRRFFEALAQRFTVVRFDARGNGLSQRAVGPPELDGFVADAEAVVRACGLESFTLWGSSFGGPIAIAYADRHPDQVNRLVLEGTYPTWTDTRTPQQQRAAADLIRMLRNAPALASTAVSYLTDAEPESRHETRAMRVMNSVDPDFLASLYVLAGHVDVRAETEALRVPTLVMHAAESHVYPAEGARVLAAAIGAAHYVELRGRHHNPWEGDADAALDAMCSFCGVAPVRVAPATALTADAGVSVVMFTDIVGSTEIADRFGDTIASTLRRVHERIVSEAAGGYGGTIVKFLGDGALVRFGAASMALAAARAILDAVDAYNRTAPQCLLLVRIGLNAGELIEEAGDIHGSAVNLAARLCSTANENEVLVADAVRHLAIGKGFLFADRGAVRIKGFADDVRVHALVV